MSDATSNVGDFGTERVLLEASVGALEVQQMPSGLAGIRNSKTAASSGGNEDFATSGRWAITKATGFVGLKGGLAYWDYSANNVNYKKVNDRDFPIGTFAETALSTATNCIVNLNVVPRRDIDLINDPGISVLAGTPAAGGFGYPVRLGGSLIFELTATNEAQKVDLLGVDGFSPAANAIVEIVYRVISDGAGTVVDASLGVASASHATDADSIAEHLFVHMDANNVNINLQSKDGTTTVVATDTTYDYTEGSTVAVREEIWFDFANPADVQCYRNGVLALDATAFNLGAAVGPLFPLVHLEKTASTDTYKLAIDRFTVRFAEQ